MLETCVLQLNVAFFRVCDSGIWMASVDIHWLGRVLQHSWDGDPLNSNQVSKTSKGKPAGSTCVLEEDSKLLGITQQIQCDVRRIRLSMSKHPLWWAVMHDTEPKFAYKNSATAAACPCFVLNAFAGILTKWNAPPQIWNGVCLKIEWKSHWHLTCL